MLRSLLTSSLALSCFVSSAAAQTFLINTGSSTVLEAQATNAPFTTGLSSTSVWNNVSADTASGLSWADGTVDNGLSIDIGASGTNFSTGATFNFSTAHSSNAGTAFSTLAANGTPQKDFIFAGTSGQNTAVGLRVNGLTAGIYNVYVTGWNSAAATLNRGQQFWVGAASSGTSTFVIGDLTLANGFTNESITNANMGTWSDGINYSLMQVELDAGESLVILANGTSASEFRGFLNLIQVETVSLVPEPSIGCLVLGALGFLGVMRRRPLPGSRQ